MAKRPIQLIFLGLLMSAPVWASESSHSHMDMDHSGHEMSSMLSAREEKDEAALSHLVPVTMTPAFSLQSAQGVNVTEADFDGQYLLVGFGFTHCGHVCPTLLSTWAQAVKKLPEEKRSRVQGIFVSLDPERDTAVITDAYSKNFDPEFIGLSGSPEQVAAAANNYRITYVKVPLGSDNYKIDHTSISYLLSPEREVVALLGFGTSPDELAASLDSGIQ